MREIQGEPFSRLSQVRQPPANPEWIVRWKLIHNYHNLWSSQTKLDVSGLRENEVNYTSGGKLSPRRALYLSRSAGCVPAELCTCAWSEGALTGWLGLGATTKQDTNQAQNKMSQKLLFTDDDILLTWAEKNHHRFSKKVFSSNKLCVICSILFTGAGTDSNPSGCACPGSHDEIIIRPNIACALKTLKDNFDFRFQKLDLFVCVLF